MVHFRTPDEIEIRERQRELQIEVVRQLQDSILTKGLFHPIVIGADESSPSFLIAGEHRLAAIARIHESDEDFFFNGKLVDRGAVPCVYLNELSPADILEAELEENIIRAAMPWTDRTAALAKIYELRRSENPSHTYQDEAKILQSKGDTRNRNYIAGEIKDASLLAPHLSRPSIAKARTQSEALNILYKEEGAKLEAELIERRRKQAEEEGKTVPSYIKVINDDMYKVLPQLEDGQFDLILADPVYGIGADTAGFRSRTVEHHNYSDSTEDAETMLKAILVEGFRLCAPRANLFLFGDIDLFPFFKKQSAMMGWKPYRTPIIWQKSKSEGLAPWGREGPRRTYELIFFATKGNKGLFQSPVDILDFPRVPRKQRRYGAEKPIALMKRLVECASMPGDYVLDPCCGAGSTLAACRELHRKALGIEIDESAYNMAVVAADRNPYETDETDNADDQTDIEDIA